MTTSFAALLGEIGTLRLRAIDEVRTCDPRMVGRPPSEDAWSVGEIVEHLVLAEDYGIRGLWGAIEQARAGESRPLSDELAGRALDEIFAGQPAQLDAPPAVVPTSGGAPVDYWLGRFDGHQTAIESIAHAMDAAGPERVIYPHFRVGPLNGPQRMYFFRWHLARHLQQLERTIQVVGAD